MNGSSVVQVLRLIVAFLLHNRLTDCGLIFFVDGLKPLHAWLIKGFSYFRWVQLILDGYPLEEKCAPPLSLALAGKEKRKQALEEVLRLLWLGLVSQTIAYLRQLDPSWVKSQEALEQMIKYLERNQGYLPA